MNPTIPTPPAHKDKCWVAFDPRAMQSLASLRAYALGRLNRNVTHSLIVRRALDVYAAHIYSLIQASPMKGPLTIDEHLELRELRDAKKPRPAVEVGPVLDELAAAVADGLSRMTPEQKAAVMHEALELGDDEKAMQ